MYVLWTLTYTFGTGLTYAAFSAFDAGSHRQGSRRHEI